MISDLSFKSKVASSKVVVIVIAFAGHTASQVPQNMQRSRRNSGFLFVLVLVEGTMVIAVAGQSLAQSPQPLHFSMSCSILPLNLSGRTASSKGYLIVAVFRFNTVDNTSFWIAPGRGKLDPPH